jgi:hypothetical protein
MGMNRYDGHYLIARRPALSQPNKPPPYHNDRWEYARCNDERLIFDEKGEQWWIYKRDIEREELLLRANLPRPFGFAD